MNALNLRPALTVAGIIIPFFIAVLLYNSTKERNEEILEIQTTVSNSEAIIALQTKQNSLEVAIEDLVVQLSKTQSDYGQMLLALENLSSNRQPNKKITRHLDSILDQLEAQNKEINELRQRVSSANASHKEVEAIVIETIERLLRTNR